MDCDSKPKKDTDSNKPSSAPEPPPEPFPVDADVAIRLKERREVRRELKERAREAQAALEEAERKRREREGLPHSVTPAEMELMGDKKDPGNSSSYYSTESEAGEGNEQAGGVRLVPKAEAKPKASDPDDPESSSSSSSDDEEGEEEEQLEVDDFPPDEGEEAVKDGKGKKEDSSEESELFESSAAPVVAKVSAIPAGAEAKGQKVKVQLPKKSAAGVPKPMPRFVVPSGDQTTC